MTRDTHGVVGDESNAMTSEVLVFGIFYIRPLPGPPAGPPPGGNAYQYRHQPNNISNVDFGLTLLLDSHKKSPTTTLNKRSLWESLFRPRTRPSKCATPYSKIPNSSRCCCKLILTRLHKCNPVIAHAEQSCTKPTTRASRVAARVRSVLTLRRV